MIVANLVGLATSSSPEITTRTDSKEISLTNHLIYYHGRWDSAPGTWWAGSGFKIHVENLKSLKLELGPNTTSPIAALGVSVDYQDFITVNVSEGVNDIPLASTRDSPMFGQVQSTVVRLNVEGWQNNRVDLQKIILNSEAELLPYTPSKFAFQFIGDSLSAGQFLPQGVNQAWPFLVAQRFKAEHRINAQPGATLKDIPSYGNVHGVSYQYFKTEDTGYFYTTDHNFTTPWNFENDRTTHIVIHIGANDASQNVTAEDFVETYNNFMTRLRTIYPRQPVFVLSPWGWPNPTGPNSFYYDGQYQRIVDIRHNLGDKNVFLVNTTGWVSFEDVFPDNVHPDVGGHQHIADLFTRWLETWGLKPKPKWAT